MPNPSPFSRLWVGGGAREAQGRQVSARRSPGGSPPRCQPPSVPGAGAPSELRAGELRAARLRLRSHVVERRAEGREAGWEGRGSGVKGEGEGRGRPPQFAPRRGSDTQRAGIRRAGPAAAAAASTSSEAARAAGNTAAAGRPRRAGLGSGCQRHRSRHRSRSGRPIARGWAGLGRAPGAGAGVRGKTHGRARLSRGAARDCTRTGASRLRAALGLAPGPGG